MKFDRRDVLKMVPSVAAAGWLMNFQAIAAPYTKMVKITGIKVMGLDNIGEGCLVKIETDAGISGYGEAGYSAQATRAIVEMVNPILVGQDPLAIERHFYMMTAVVHPYAAYVAAVGGFDIALWDLAGKITGLPVYRLLGGPFQKELPVYSHGSISNILDKGECQAWWQSVKGAPEGFHTFKFSGFPFGPGATQRPAAAPRGARAATNPSANFAGNFASRTGKGGFPYSDTLDGDDFRRTGKGYMNIRETVGDDVDIAMHVLNQFDTRSAIGLCKAIEPSDPLWIEDPLTAHYTEAWLELKRSTRVPILTGERVELVKGFKPFLDNQVVDMLHPDTSASGGITGCREIAAYAAITNTPVGFHSGPGTLVKFYGSLHLAASTRNLFKVENVLGAFRGFQENMAQGTKPAVRNSMISVPEGPGLGLEMNEDWVKSHLLPGEKWWG